VLPCHREFYRLAPNRHPWKMILLTSTSQSLPSKRAGPACYIHQSVRSVRNLLCTTRLPQRHGLRIEFAIGLGIRHLLEPHHLRPIVIHREETRVLNDMLADRRTSSRP